MWNITEFDEIDSTNRIAKEQLTEGLAHHGDVFQAWHQLAGRGRFADRSWQDEPGNCLLMTIVLERLPVQRVEFIQYVVAVAVSKSLRRIVKQYGDRRDAVLLKWPNDILLGGRKVCGILSEGIWQSQSVKGVVIGIGINVRQQSFEEALSETATSLFQSGVRLMVNEVRDIILDTIANDLARYGELPDHTVVPSILAQLRVELQWMRSLPPIEVLVSNGTMLHDMRYDGISDNGALLLRHADGTIEALHAGSLIWSESIRRAAQSA